MARIGVVSYLNARPLSQGLAEAQFAHPSVLAEDLHAGKLDAALVPVAECLRYPGYQLVDGVAIASRGPVYSVMLAHEGPLETIKSVSLDSASQTSALLVRVVLEKFFGLTVEYRPQGEKADAQLWIGDQAIRFRKKNPQVSVLDLGEIWWKETGSPFVFAVWAIRPEFSKASDLARQLRETAKHGLAERRSLAANDFEFHYLTESIHYGCGTEEKQGLRRFAEYLVELKILPVVPDLIWI